MSKKIARMFAVMIPAIILTTIANVFICSIVSQTVMYQLMVNGVEKHLALLISLILAIIVYSYIVNYSRIRQLFKI